MKINWLLEKYVVSLILKEQAAAKLFQNHQILNSFSREEGAGGTPN